MKLPEMKRFQWNYPALAFAVPMVMMLVFMFITSCEPFGSHCMLYSDMYHQYYPFFCAYRRAILSGDSLLYSWNVGMGMEYLGLISYYLASPLNLISVLLPEAWTLEYFTLLLPIKMSLASLFFAIMLKKLFQKNDLSIVLFGSFYGMCAWAFGYNWNIMWLDGFAILPLVALGTIQLLRDRKFILYTVTLFLAVFSNYYVGFFVCIFVLMLFFCYQICRFKSPWRTLEDFLRIGVFTLLAIGMTAVLELPTLAALQDTQSSINTFPEGFSVNIATGEAVTAAREAWAAFYAAKADGAPVGELFTALTAALAAAFPPVLDAMKQVAGNMGAAITPTYIDGLPNLYCGIFPIALGCLFLLSGQVKLRDKLCCAGLLLFFMISFIFRQLDYIWHGLHFPNQIPHRFSFLYSFVILYMAYRAWILRDSFRIWQVLAAGILSLGILLISPQNRENILYVLINVLFLAGYLAAMLYANPHWPSKKAEPLPSAEAEALDEPEALPPKNKFFRFPDAPIRRHQAACVLAVFMAVELVLNLATFGTSFPVSEYDYPKKDAATSSMIQVMKELEEDTLFYRTETTHSQILNDAALNNYNGLSTFTSSANVQVTTFTQALGFGAYNTYNRYLYEESSPVTALFMSLKYLIERDDPTNGNAYFDAIHSYNGVTLLENNYYLPLGFLAESTLADVRFPNGSGGFSFQNTLFTAATGVSDKVWSTVPAKDLHVSSENTGSGGQLIYEYTISQTGYFCLDVNLYSLKNFTVWHNGDRVFAENFSLAQMFGVGDVVPGDVVQVVVETEANATPSVNIKAAVLNEEVFRQGYAVLSASTLELTDFSNTYISGTVSCDRDGLLYTSIPQCGNERIQGYYDEENNWVPAQIDSVGNWKVLVDGEEAEIRLVGDCMVAVALNQGQHTVEFVYQNPAYELGLKISLICGGVFAAITLACYLPGYIKKKRAK